jgi:Tol biopolymer transport system component
MSASRKQSVIFLWLGLCVAIVALWLGDAAISPPKAEAMTLLADQSPSAVQTIMRGRIAFVSERNGNPEIYVMDANGRNVRRLTRNNVVDDSPAWSPDGQLIAFVSERDGNREIYVMNANGSALRRLTRNSARDDSPAWSPDGQQIAFVSERDGVPQIYVMRADGEDVRRLTQTETVETQPAWSPDGRLIAFVSDRDGNPEIYLMNADGTDPRRLTDDPALDSTPRWSPNSKRLLFVSERENASLQIFSMNSEGKDVRLITAVYAADARNFAPVWSPDGEWIAFTTDRDGYQEIYAVRADGSGLRNLTRNRADDYSPSWAATAQGGSGGRPTATPTPLGGGRQIGMKR